MTGGKWQALNIKLSALEKVGVAFSGGVDSSLLLKIATIILKENVTAVTFASPLLPHSELLTATEFAKSLGVKHQIIETCDLELGELRRNGKERCYYCKKRRLEKALAWADDNNVKYILEGSNADDRQDFRPGMRVLTELAPRVYSPFLELDITKREIREQAKKLGLEIWQKPSSACLASRIEYDTELSQTRLQAVEKAEEFLGKIAKGYIRVRNHGMIARIEVMPSEMPILVKQALNIDRELKKLGFWYVTIDLAGYRQGSQNEIFSKERFS